MSSLHERLLGSIRARLLLLLFGGLGAMLLALFVGLDWNIDRQIFGRLDGTLLARARGIAVLLESHPGGSGIAELQTIIPEYAGGGHTDFLQVWDQLGRTVLNSASNAAANLQPPHASVPANAPYFYDLSLPDGHRGRAVALRLSVGGDALMVVAEERDQVDLLEHRVHVALLLGVLGSAVLAGLLAALAVRGGLRPLFDFAARTDVDREPFPEALPMAGMPRELRPFAGSLNRAFERLQQALERERRFARDVAHELRTPLAEARMTIELAQRQATASVPLQSALASIERMRRSVDGLLALSRYEAGMEQPQIEPLDLAELLRRSLALVAGPASQRGVVLQVALPGEQWVLSDPALLERIVDNLLLNAVEYAPPHSMIELQLDSDASGAQLRIGNRAPGLEPADLPRLGERFWRKSPAREASQHGGLGLALSRTLAAVLGLQLDFALQDEWLWASLRGLRGIDAALTDASLAALPGRES